MKFFIPRLFLLTIFAVLFFIIDICSFFWLQTHVFYLLFSFLICCSWYLFTPLFLLFGTTLLSAQTLIIDQGFITPLFAQLTILALLTMLRDRLYLTRAIPPLAFLAYYAITTHFWPIIAPLQLQESYTIMAIFGNLTAIGIFSLKLKTSKTRQSLVPIA